MEGENGDEEYLKDETESRGEILVAKVVTDEQIQTLRKQIAAYTIISEQLRRMHDVMSVQYLAETGSFYNLYGDPYLTFTSSRIASRNRWTPKSTQLKILEHEFEECNGNPGKQKITEITAQLAQHGPITESSVYNWFQNRRARCKRKKLEGGEAPETKNEACKKKRKKPDSSKTVENAASSTTWKAENLHSQSAEIGNQMLPFDYFSLTSVGSFGCGGWDEQFEGNQLFG
ncbi:hypothetical protein SLEP1_g57591 [Rubroshorea leprosula]|uniref:Homeobox domain-containing protein n=1 Tax=Rubroshorea leprosula TaxID=152421 RepID=A0AAV5MN33_9ROSI|nr:hypothetical protein SLEP1_g57591 [Rubroshorea leprosula]